MYFKITVLLSKIAFRKATNVQTEDVVNYKQKINQKQKLKGCLFFARIMYKKC